MVKKGEALFPRIDVKKELQALDELKKQQEAAKAAPAEEKAEETEEPALIDIDQFDAVKLKVARITSAEKVKKSDKLLKIELKLGNETRTVVSGIAQYYEPEQLIGKLVILVHNLKPAKLKGILSEGMLLCADDGNGAVKLLTVDGDIADGSIVG